MSGEKTRKYYSRIKYDKKIYLVYCKNTHLDPKSSNRLLYRTDGPFKSFKKAQEAMIEYLSNGVCSWIVSYEG